MQAIFSKFRIINFLWIALGIWAIITTAHFTSISPIDFDEAYNLQTAQSLATHFSYSSTYQPSSVYAPQITTNGPIQYFAAALFKLTGNVDSVAIGSTVTAMALFVLGLFLMRPWLASFPILLQNIWLIFFLTSKAFVGEIWGTAFIFIGIACMKPLDPINIKTLLQKPLFYASAACLAIAISSKLILFFAIMPLIFALGHQAVSQANVNGNKNFLQRVKSTISFTATLGGLAVLFFIMQFSFSVLHSNGFSINAIPETLRAFIAGHIGQGQNHHLTASSTLQQIQAFTSPIMLLACMCAAIVLLFTNWAYVFFIATVLAFYFYYGMTERELLPMFLLVFFLGMKNFEVIVGSAAHRMRCPIAPYRIIPVGLIFAVWTICGAKSTIAATSTIQNRSYAVQCSALNYHYHPALVAAIRSQKYVVTSGWWQFPDISIRWGFHFYDRMAQANANLPKHDVALLFDKGNHIWPLTAQSANCASTIYADGPLTLCRVRTDIPLNFQQRDK